jgi:hypothetical protein
MASKLKFQPRGSGRRGEVTISGTITVGASGAIASQTGEDVTAAKNAAAGRYDLTFDRIYKTGSVRFDNAMLVRPNTTSFGNTNANLVQGQAGADDGHATLQCILASSGVDTNPASGHVIHYSFTVQEL